MRVSESVTIVFAAGSLILSTAILSSAAQATPIICSSTIVLAGGNGYVLDSALTPGVCVQTSAALFGGFGIAGLPAGGGVSFNFTTFGTPLAGYQGISFNDNYAAGHSYTASYAVDMLAGPALFMNVDGDFTQNRGVSTLITTTVEAGTGSIVWKKTGASGSGPDEIDFAPGYTQLHVTNTLTDNGSVSAISNTLMLDIIPVPEPLSASLFAAGLLGLGLLRRKRA